MEKIKVGFIGCGNMGGALANAVAKSGLCEILLTDKDCSKANTLTREVSGSVTDLEWLCKNAKYIFLGVKPQGMADLIDDIAPVLKSRNDRFILVTMAAGISISALSKMIGEKYPTIRIMPNTPVCVGAGMILYSLCPVITSIDEQEFCEILKCSGKLDKLDESLIDAGCAISGCGPAFVYMFAESMAKAGSKLGLNSEKATEYAAQTLLGAAKLMLESGQNPETLRQAVCSKGGATIEGVKVFQNSEFDKIINNALNASYNRTLELKK